MTAFLCGRFCWAGSSGERFVSRRDFAEKQSAFRGLRGASGLNMLEGPSQGSASISGASRSLPENNRSRQGNSWPATRDAR
jgi:hypothetical protein